MRIITLKSSLAVTDGLMFNMDATNVTNDKSTWGDNISLRYFDDTIYDTVEKRTEAYNEESKYSNDSQFEGYDRKVSNDVSKYIDTKENAFKFNGNNYVEIYNKDGFDFSKGFTIELYGNFKDYVGATNQEDGFLSILGMWSGKYNEQCKPRFGYYQSSLYYSLDNYMKGVIGSWSDEKWPWNQKYEYKDFKDKEVYITIVFESNVENQTTQAIYANGNLLESGWLDKEYYDKFISNGKTLNYIEFGRCTMGSMSNWCYTKGVCYTARLYNRGLSAEEVSKNVTQTKLYRETIQK